MRYVLRWRYHVALKRHIDLSFPTWISNFLAMAQLCVVVAWVCSHVALPMNQQAAMLPEMVRKLALLVATGRRT